MTEPNSSDPEFEDPQEQDLNPEDVEEIDAALADVDAQFSEESPEADAEVEEEDPTARELAERVEDLQRLSAEYTNYRRRTERERQAAVDAAKAGVVAELLPIVDDLVLAKQHGDLEEGPLKAFADKFRNTLTSLGVEAFGEEGEPFDPEFHEAVQDMSSGEEKVLGTVLRQGFRIGERIIRPAMVVIGD